MSTKLYKIGEAAGALDLKTSVLRFWEGEFPQLQPVRTPKGQRMYREADMELLRQIRSLVHEQGMTLDGAKRVLAGELAAPDLGEKGERGGEIPSLRQKRDDLSDYLVEYLTPPEQAPWPTPKPLSLLETKKETKIVRDDGLLRSAVEELKDLRELLTAAPEKFSKAEEKR